MTDGAEREDLRTVPTEGQSEHSTGAGGGWRVPGMQEKENWGTGSVARQAAGLVGGAFRGLVFADVGCRRPAEWEAIKRKCFARS